METKGQRAKTVIEEKYSRLNSNLPNVSEIEKEGFDEDNNFIDYFMIIGVKPEIFKNSSLYNSNSISDINANLIPQIITKFPKIDKKHIIVENTIPQQLFPHGFNAIESEEQPENQFYSVILDNQLYSSIYIHKYIACLLTYESLGEYEKLNQKYKSSDILFKVMKSESEKDIKTQKSEKYKNFYIPKVLCLVSVYPAFNRLQEILESIHDLAISNIYTNLYIDRLIEKLIFEIPKLPRGLKKIYLSLPPNTKINLTEKRMNDFPCVNVNLPQFLATFEIANVLEIFRYLLLETKLIFFGSKLYDLTNAIISIISIIYPFKYQFQIVSVLPSNLYNFIETISPYIFGINELYDENFFKNNKINIDESNILIIDIDRNKYFLLSKDEKTVNKDFPPFPKSLKEKIEKEYNKYKKEIAIAKEKEFKDEQTQREEENYGYQLIFFNFMISLLKDYPKFLSKDYGVTKDISMSIKDMIDLTSYTNSYNVNERDFYSKIFTTQMFIEFIYKRMMPKNFYEKVEILFFEEKINEIKTKKSFFKSKENTNGILLSSHDYDYDNDKVCIDCSNDFEITENVYEYIMENKEEAEKLFINNGYDMTIDEENKKINFEYHIFPCLLSDKFFSLNYEYYKKPENYFHVIDEINLKIVNKSGVQFSHKFKEALTEEGNDIYLCYLIMFSLTLWYTDEWERESRFLQMIEIIEKVQGHDIQIFELLFKALVDIKWDDKDIILLYKKFIHLNLNPTWKIFSLVSKIIKKKSNVKNKKELLSQETKYNALRSKKKLRKPNINSDDELNFRSRTLKSKLENDKILSEDVIFYAYGKCPNCDKYINMINLCSNLGQLKTKTVAITDEKRAMKPLFRSLNSTVISSNFNLKKEEEEENNYKNKTEDFFKCPNKHQKEDSNDYLKLKLKLNHGIELFNTKMASNFDNTSISFTTILMSPSTIKMELLKLVKKLEEEGKKFDVENFQKYNKRLFWNIVWYFELNDIEISFMLPYESEMHADENLNIENLKKFIDIKNKPEKDINIEKIVQNRDLNLDFLVCSNRDSLLGKNIKTEEIKNNLFDKNKNRYEKNELVLQKIFKFEISDKSGFISYLSLNNYMENIGYSEYPNEFKEIPEITLDYINEKKNVDNKDINDEQKTQNSHHVKFLDDKNLNINKNYSKLKTVNLEEKKGKVTTLMRSKYSLGKKGLLKKSKKENKKDNIEENNTINKQKKTNNEIKGNEEEEEEEEEIDVLSQFKESQKKIGKIDLDKIMGIKAEDNKLNNKAKILRKSTLRGGFLGEN